MHTTNYKQFTHEKCEFFPCHQGIKVSDFNCLFCYCPLYVLKDHCGGQFTYIASGIKSCAMCTLPHDAGGYEHVSNKMMSIMDMGKITE